MIHSVKQALLSAGLDTFEISDDLLTELAQAAANATLADIRDAARQPDGSYFHDNVWKAVCATLDAA